MHGIDRRSLIVGTSAAALLGSGRASAVSAGSEAGSRTAPVRLADDALLDAYLRLRGSTDGSLTFGWLDSLRYAVIDNEAHLLCRVLAGSLQRFERRSASLYEATILEVAHYVDPHSGALLDTLQMPVVDREVEVPTYRFGPTPVRFAVRLDEEEEFSSQVEGQGSDNFAPDGLVHLRRSITEPRMTGVDLYVRHEEHGRVIPRKPAVRAVTYREWTIWHGPAAAAMDRDAAAAAGLCQYTAMTSWRPWMQLDGLSGHTLDTGQGGKVLSLEGLPAAYLELTARLHPEFLEDPEKALRARD